MELQEARLFHQQGFIPSYNDDEESFRERVSAKLEWSQKLWNEDLTVESENFSLPLNLRFPESTLKDGGKKVMESFGCLPSWVPAYHSNQGLPLLTGGMAVELSGEVQPQQVFFQLKETFGEKDRWFIYPREEILSHEMCHVVRFPLESTRFEETLAYSVSGSGFRRWLGGALLTPKDNLLLFVGILCWIAVDILSLLGVDSLLVSTPLRILMPILITLGLIRNFKIRQELKSSKENLEKIFSKKLAQQVMFCLGDEEILKLSHKRNKNDLIQWWTELPGFRGDFLRKVFPFIEGTAEVG